MTVRIRPVALLVLAVVSALFVAARPGPVRYAKAAVAGPVHSITVSAADFHPISDDTDFLNYGFSLISDGAQVARVPIPAETVVITTVKARVHDDTSGDLCVSLFRVVPADGGEDNMGWQCTSGASTQDPQLLSWGVFKRFGGYNTPYLHIQFDTKSAWLEFYGATVFYKVVV